MSLLELQTPGELECDGAPYQAPDFAAAEVRTLNADHLADIQQLLTGLDQASRCARFGWASNDAALDAHAQDAVAHASSIFGVFVERQLRGVLEIYHGSASNPAEVALIVAPDWRRRGLGWMLLQAAMHWAAEVDAGTMRLIFSRHNWPMRQLTAKACARFDMVLDEISAEITAPPIRPELTQFVPPRHD
jgi:GNAT superfamily N-acetyltransferase